MKNIQNEPFHKEIQQIGPVSYTHLDVYKRQELGTEITVVGEFQAYEENGRTGYHLINARLA